MSAIQPPGCKKIKQPTAYKSGALALWLMRLIPNQTVRIQTLAVFAVFLVRQFTLKSASLNPDV